jgi:hypothetical protein
MFPAKIISFLFFRMPESELDFEELKESTSVAKTHFLFSFVFENFV